MPEFQQQQAYRAMAQGNGETMALSPKPSMFIPPEEPPADYRFFQRRSDGGGLSGEGGAEYLLGAARSLGLDRRNFRRLANRLADNALTVTQYDVMESFDAANANRSRAAGIRKSLAAARRFDSYEPLLDTMTPGERRRILRETLEIAAQTGQMPILQTSADHPGQAQLIYREAEVNPGRVRGTYEVSDQVHLWQYNARTNESVPIAQGEEITHTISDGHAYHSNGQSIRRDQERRLEDGFRTPNGQQALARLYDGVFQTLENPAHMQRLLNPVVGNIENAYGLRPVNFEVNPAPVAPGDMAAYTPSDHAMVINHQAFVQDARDYMAEQGLNLDNPADREQVQNFVFKKLVNGTAHELTHADQARRIEASRNGQLLTVSNADRVDDYRINTDYYNSAGETSALIGRDQGHYRYQPLEEDAWSVGEQAGELALDAVFSSRRLRVS